jgi:hypothetical protein
MFYYCLHKIPAQIFDKPSKNFDSVGDIFDKVFDGQLW